MISSFPHLLFVRANSFIQLKVIQVVINWPPVPIELSPSPQHRWGGGGDGSIDPITIIKKPPRNISTSQVTTLCDVLFYDSHASGIL